ncbi:MULTISPECIES: hypothetical protein [unclassified Sinorhizobium]|uniref:hypothetical protein n=1 Tax=unclassified Sinorhizobium TaxID=2613772 RepID=UPI0035237DF2
MAKIGNNYQAEYENTEKQGGGGDVLPHMYARLQAESINLPDTKDGKGTQADITFEIIEPAEFARRTFREYWTIVHADGYQNGSYKFGKPRFDRFGRAVGEEITHETDTDDLIFKSFVAEIGIQIGNANPAGGFYRDKNQIERFFYDDDNAKEPIPELGVIGDGTQGKKRNEAAPAAANDNRQPAQQQQRPAQAAAATGSRPWGKK